MKNKRVYPVILTPADNIILVEVPDMEILTEGKDYQDAIEMARDAIGLKGITLEDAGKTIPDASDISVINPEKGTFAEDGKGYVTLVDVDFLIYRRRVDSKAVRRNVTLSSASRFNQLGSVTFFRLCFTIQPIGKCPEKCDTSQLVES